MSGVSGIFVVIIIHYYNKLHICFICNIIAILIVICILHFRVVESVRFSFLNKKYNNVIKDLKKIAIFNGNTEIQCKCGKALHHKKVLKIKIIQIQKYSVNYGQVYFI